jgi:hypothetical protein
MRSRHLDPEGPLTNLSQAYFRSLDMMWKDYEPAFMSFNSECMRLDNRRTKAWLDIPACLGRCKTPQDVLNEQVKFWQQMGKDYAEGTRQLTIALRPLQSLPGATSETLTKNLSALNEVFAAATKTGSNRRAA